jgi:hypothetical protein
MEKGLGWSGMESPMVEQRTVDELITSLVRIAADPKQVSSLHEILGSFCHQCRNLLNSLKLSLYLARRDQRAAVDDSWNVIEPRYRAVEQFYDRLQLICRPMALVPLRTSLASLLDDRYPSWAEWMAEHDRRLEWNPPEAPTIGEFDPIRLGEGLDAFVAWRAQAGAPGEPARLSWREEDQRFRLDWDESGAPHSRHGDACGECTGSFALPLLARVVSVHGGTIDVDFREGLHLRIQWPLILHQESRA